MPQFEVKPSPSRPGQFFITIPGPHSGATLTRAQLLRLLKDVVQCAIDSSPARQGQVWVAKRRVERIHIDSAAIYHLGRLEFLVKHSPDDHGELMEEEYLLKHYQLA